MTKLKIYILILITAIVFLGVSATDIYIASLPQMVRDFNVTPNIINFTIASCNIGFGLIMLFAAIFSDRFGRRNMILFSIGLFLLASFAICFSPSIWVIIILRFIQGIGGGTMLIVTRLVLKDIMTEHEQITATAIILAGFFISPAIAPVLGAHLAHYFGWRSCFVFSGVLGVILFAFTLRILPETNTTPLVQLPRLFDCLKDYFVILSDKVFLSLIFIYACGSATFYSFIGISSYLYINELHISPVAYSYVYIFVAIAYLIGNQCLIVFNRKNVQLEKMFEIGILSTSIGSFVVLVSIFFKNPIIIAVILTVGILFLRIANAVVSPLSQVRVANYFQEKGGQALGLAMGIAVAFNGIVVSFVALFHRIPLFGLIFVTSALTICSVIVFKLTKPIIMASKGKC